MNPKSKKPRLPAKASRLNTSLSWLSSNLIRTMKSKLLILFTLALAGCVPSWNPFYTEKDLAFESALVGSWRPVEAKENSKEFWEFTKAGDKLYQLTQTDEEGRKANFEARLFKLKEHLFLDLYLTKVEGDDLKVNAWAGISLVPAHLLLKVDLSESGVKLAAMNPEWLKEFLKQNPGAIAHRAVSDGSIVLAAGTDELQKFVLAHLGDKDFIGGPMEMKRR